jgi:hypothetical protein
MAGNPAGVKGKGEWTVGVAGTYMNQTVGFEETLSRRILVKSSWGLTPELDAYIMLGGIKLKLKSLKQGISNYEDKTRFGYGLGFDFSIKKSTKSDPIGIWAGGQLLRFLSQSIFTDSFEAREYDLDYDWREITVYGGLTFQYQLMRFYFAGTGWIVQRLYKRKEYIIYSDSKIFSGGNDEGTFQSGLWTGGIIGFEIALPERYSIGLECLIFNKNNYRIMIGICQTGNP